MIIYTQQSSYWFSLLRSSDSASVYSTGKRVTLADTKGGRRDGRLDEGDGVKRRKYIDEVEDQGRRRQLFCYHSLLKFCSSRIYLFVY